MSDGIELPIIVRPEMVGWEEFESALDELLAYYETAWAEASKTVNKQMTDAFKLAGDDIVKSFGAVGTSMAATTKDALSGTVSAVFKGDMDSIEGIWEDAWINMADSTDKILDKLFNQLMGRIQDMAGNIGYDLILEPAKDWFMGSTDIGKWLDKGIGSLTDWILGNNTDYSAIQSGWDAITGEIDANSSSWSGFMTPSSDYASIQSDWEGITSGIESATSAWGGLADMTTNFDAIQNDWAGINAEITEATSAAGSWTDGLAGSAGGFLGGQLGGRLGSEIGGPIGGKLGGMAGKYGGQYAMEAAMDYITTTATTTATQAAAAAAGAASSGMMGAGGSASGYALANLGIDSALAAEVGGAGAIGSGTSSLLAGGATTALAGVGGVLAVAEFLPQLLGDEQGMVSTIMGGMMETVMGGGKREYTPQQAQSLMGMEFQEILDSLEGFEAGEISLRKFSEAAADSAQRMDHLSSWTQITSDELDGMIDTLGAENAMLVETGQATDMVSLLMGNFTDSLGQNSDECGMSAENLDQYYNKIKYMGLALKDAGVQVGGFDELLADLQMQFHAGEISADQMSEQLEGKLTGSLMSAAQQGEITAEQMRGFLDIMKETSREWRNGFGLPTGSVLSQMAQGSDDLDALAMGLPEGMSTDASAAWGIGGLEPDIGMGAGFFTGMGEEIIEATEEFRIMGDEIELLKMRLKEASRVGDQELSASLRTQIIDLQELNEVILMPIEGMEQFGIATGHSAGATFDLNGLIAGSIESMPIWTEAMAGAGLGAGGLTDRIEDLLDALDLAGLNTMGLSELAMDLTDQFELGEISSHQMSEQLQEEFNKALLDAAAQGLLTTLQVQELGRAIEDIPSYKRVHIDQQYTTSGNRDSSGSGSNTQSHHIGGMVLHQGGGVWPRLHTGALVSNLAHDEVPIIARRGEFVIREEAVNANTLPTLHALNQTGNNASGYGTPINFYAPLVEVNGNILGSDDNFEDLVRQIETKLREVMNSRY